MARTVAVVGASSDRSKYGNKSVRAHVRAGWVVYPIHPTETEIEGLRVYPRIEDVPTKVDRITLYVAPMTGMGLLPAIAAAKPAELFVNPGAESDGFMKRATELGLDPIYACSIVDLGMSPSEL